MARSQPNILIFMTDQEQAQVLGQGHPCRTPSADRLAAEGVRFNAAYTVAAHCCPSRASFMTGLAPSRHGVYNNISNATAIHHAPYPGTRHFSQSLQAAGYRLSYSGKWHVSAEQNPAAFGWEESRVTGAAGSPEPNWARWTQSGRAGRVDRPERGRGEILRPGWGTYRLFGESGKALEETADYRIVSAGIEAMQRLAGEGVPWCVYIGVHGPHDPYVVPKHYAQMYDPDSVALPESYADALTDKPGIYRRIRRQLWSQLGEAETRAAIAHYWGYCTMMDDLLGRALDALDATGQAEDTLVLFLSDHGDYAGAHGLFMKGIPAFDEAYHIPCIARWPAGIAGPGRQVDDLVAITDVAPTLIELSGGQVPEGLSGRSLAPFLRDPAGPDSWRDALLMQMNGVELYYTQRAVRTATFKYVFNGFDEDELYDLRSDPDERINLAANPAYEAIKRDLVERLWVMAEAENDIIANPYPPVALVPYGPTIAFSR